MSLFLAAVHVQRARSTPGATEQHRRFKSYQTYRDARTTRIRATTVNKL